MCKSIEDFAEERTVDTAIQVCYDLKQTMNETVEYVTSKFSIATPEYVIARFNALSAN